MNELKNINDCRGLKQEPNTEVRKKILDVEKKIRQMPEAMFGDCFPLKHSFADGVYVREITVPKGALIVGKIHKVAHPFFLLKGEISILTEEGIIRLKAPFAGITPAGTKRIVYHHEDTVFTTIHVTKEVDIDKIEEEIIAKSFEEFDALPDYAMKIIEGEKILCLG